MIAALGVGLDDLDYQRQTGVSRPAVYFAAGFFVMGALLTIGLLVS